MVLFDILRQSRNELLERSDWTQLPDSPLTDEKKDAYKVYRQALRDLPKSTSDINKVVWPQEPK